MIAEMMGFHFICINYMHTLEADRVRLIVIEP